MVFFPFLTILSILIGILGGYLSAAATGIMIPADYVDGLLMDFKPYSITYTLIKTVFFAYIITSISAFYGITPVATQARSALLRRAPWWPAAVTCFST